MFTKFDTEVLLLQTSFLRAPFNGNLKLVVSNYKTLNSQYISDYLSYDNMGCLSNGLLTTPVFINVTFLPGCPPGLTLIIQNHTTCSCYSVLANNMASSVQYEKKMAFCSGIALCG